MLLYCVSRPTERGSNISCLVDDLEQEVVPAGTTSLKRLLYTTISAQSRPSQVIQTLGSRPLYYCTGEESTGAEQTFRLCNCRLQSIDNG
jgi:hypothetical protein